VRTRSRADHPHALLAATYSQRAKSYAESTQNRTEEEKMAVILQPLVGDVHTIDDAKHFYPSLAGVANALDFYPLPHTSSEHGCAQIGLGLGYAVVDGTPAIHFSLADPSHLTGPADLLDLPVAALNLIAAPGERSGGLLTSLPGASFTALSTLKKRNESLLAVEASAPVPLTQDVHGKTVVFKSKCRPTQRLWPPHIHSRSASWRGYDPARPHRLPPPLICSELAGMARSMKKKHQMPEV